MTKDLRR